MAEQTPDEKKKREEATRNAPKPEPIKTRDQVQADLKAGQYAGEQTRRADNRRVSLMDQTAPAGKELIGMKSGVPIYADAKNVYGVDTEAAVPALPAQTGSAAAAAAAPSMLQRPVSQQTTTPSAQPMVFTREATDAEKNQRLQQARDAYQTGPTATATREQQAPRTNPYEPVNRGGFFSKEYAQQFQRAQAAANQRAIDRVGAPRKDLPTSTTAATNAAASAIRSTAAQPTVASAEQVRAAGFGPEKTKRLLFGVDDRGEPVDVTPDYLKRLRDRSIKKY